jgi:GntR family transcriptional regulator/MocR family aminotransferase
VDKISFQYQEHEHDEPLKDQLIKYLFTHRGVRASPEQLIIGSGASTLIFWLAFLMRKDFKRIVVEDPGYSRIRLMFEEFGYDVKPIPVKSDGIDVTKLQNVKADLICITPSHQYPTGAAMPVNNRLKILNWAKKNNAFIIEDDFDCEFRYKTRLMPALQGLDAHDRVIYIGTFSSALMPSLRVAYLILPKNFPVRYKEFNYLTNTVSYFTRRTLEHFMEQGYWERHLKRMRKVYKAKYDTCIRALKKIPGKYIDFNNTPSGLNILLHVNSPLSESALIMRASAIGILVTPASSFYANANNKPEKPQVLFEFGSVPLDEIAKVVSKLYKTWFDKHQI